MIRSRIRTYMRAALAVCAGVLASGCKHGGCIELLGKKPLMKQPWPEWLTYPHYPNAVLDSLGPGQYHYTDTWSNETFGAYRVAGKSGVVGWIVYDSLVRTCPKLPQ